MKTLGNWISGEQLMRRWRAPLATLIEAIDNGLPAYQEIRNGNLELLPPDLISRMKQNNNPMSWLTGLVFKTSDVERYEADHFDTGGDLSGKERRHYGQLKAERDTFTDAIKATVTAVCHCQGKKTKRDDLMNLLDAEYPELPQTTKDEIWKALPRKFKQGPGRPRKTAKK